MAGERDKFIAALEELGETEARSRLIKGNYGHSGETFSRVKAWLDSKEDARRTEANLRAELREESAISIARDANSISREANSLSRKARSEARRANIIAIAAMILSAAIAISVAIIQWLSKP
jgi:hypothetical protein